MKDSSETVAVFKWSTDEIEARTEAARRVCLMVTFDILLEINS